MPWHTRHTQGRQACIIVFGQDFDVLVKSYCTLNAEILFHDFKKKICSSKLIFGYINIFCCMFVDESFEIFNCSLSIVLFNFFTIFVDIQCGKPGNLKIRYVHLLKNVHFLINLFFSFADYILHLLR